MGTVEIILTILTAIFGSGNIASAVLFFKQNKKLKDIEVKKEEGSAESTNLENFGKTADAWQELYESCQKTQEYYRTLLADKDKKIRELNAQIYDLQKESNQLELENQSLKWWKCTCTGCAHRQPPREIDSNEYINR